MRRSTLRPRGALIVAAAIALISVSAACAMASRSSRAAVATTPQLNVGKTLYRKYCGKCHALNAALAAGFGTEDGLGTNGGPSFNNLRVPFNLSVLAITLPFMGHEVLTRKLTWLQVKEVSRYVATATKKHPILALGTDG